MEGNGCNMLVTKHVLLQKTLGPSLQDGEVSYAEFAAWWLGVSTMETHTENQR